MSGVETLSVATRTHGRVLVRRATDQERVLVGFHGYGEHAAAQMDRLAGVPGSGAWTLVSVQGLHRFYRGRNRETIAGWMTREDRLTAIADNVEYVERVLDAVLPGPSATLVFTGFSQGVAMAFRAAVRGRRGAQGVIAVGADVPPELLDDPSARFPRVLLLRGRADEWYTQEKMDADAAALTGRGVEVRREVFDGGHEWGAAASALMADFVSGV